MSDRNVENLVVTLHGRGWSQRRIALELGVSRNTVRGILERTRRAKQQAHCALPAARKQRGSQLDDHEPFLIELLSEHPNISAIRVWEELGKRGFTGGYWIVKKRVHTLRPRAKAAPAQRIETGPGQQGQQDWSPYTLDFTATGRQQVHCFSFVLSYSRRQYIHFGEREDFHTLIRQHIAGFERFNGVPREILYDRQKAVVLGRENGRDLYNPRFLAFATHYGIRPRALPPRKPQWKGKVERPFQYVEGNCLNARTFRDLTHLNEHAAWWMDHTADGHVHRRTGERPLDRFSGEADHLIPLPLHPYDTAEIGYRVVDHEGQVAWDGTPYTVPAAYLFDLVVVRATDTEVFIYADDLNEIAHHARAPRGQREPVTDPAHRLKRPKRYDVDALVQRMAALGDAAQRFAAGVCAAHCRGRRGRGAQLAAILAHQEHYALDDLRSALARAVRYRAFDAKVVTRILEATATPRRLPESLADAALRRLGRDLAHTAVPPRDLSTYAQAFRGERDQE